MKRLILLLVTLPGLSYAGNMNNPMCQAKTIWKAVAEHTNIPEVDRNVCGNMQLPDGKWIARFDPTSVQDYKETPEDIANRPKMDLQYYESMNKLLKMHGYQPHVIPAGLQ